VVLSNITVLIVFLRFLIRRRQWRNDGVAAASSVGGPTGGRGPQSVLEFLVINVSVCLVLLSNCYIIIYQHDFLLLIS